ncbi:MAG: hypothetical protein AAGJ35_09835, partial [Myxococcota bacterium]
LQPPPGKGSAQEVFAFDNRTDSTFTHSNQILESFRIAYSNFEDLLSSTQVQHLDAIEQLIDITYPEGTAYLKDGRQQQYGISEAMFTRLKQPDVQKILSTFPALQELFSFLERVHKEYGIVTGVSTAKSTPNSEAFDLWKQSLQYYFSLLLVVHRNEPELRQRLLSPYTELVETQQRRRHRQKQQEKTSTETQEKPSESNEQD